MGARGSGVKEQSGLLWLKSKWRSRTLKHTRHLIFEPIKGVKPEFQFSDHAKPGHSGMTDI